MKTHGARGVLSETDNKAEVPANLPPSQPSLWLQVKKKEVPVGEVMVEVVRLLREEDRQGTGLVVCENRDQINEVSLYCNQLQHSIVYKATDNSHSVFIVIIS